MPSQCCQDNKFQQGGNLMRNAFEMSAELPWTHYPCLPCNRHLAIKEKHTHMHPGRHAHTHTCTHARTHATTCASTHAHMHTHTYAHTHTHTQSHTDKQTHTHTTDTKQQLYRFFKLNRYISNIIFKIIFFFE